MTHLDFTQPPFDVITPAERESLKKQSQVLYLPKDDELDDDAKDFFYVVLKGNIAKRLNDDYISNFHASEFSHDWFDARLTPQSSHQHHFASSDQNANIDSQKLDGKATQNLNQNNERTVDKVDKLIAPHQDTYQYDALEDSLLLQVNGKAIDRLCAQNRHIRALLYGDLLERIKASKQKHSLPSQYGETQQLMLQPITAVPLLLTHTLDASATLVDAADIMTKVGIKHVLLNRANTIERHPTRTKDSALGIITDTDICRAISERADPATTPCASYANFRMRTIEEHQDVSDALLTMIRYRVRRLPVIGEHGDIIGVLGQSDLMAYLSHHSQLITLQIEQAQNIDQLSVAVERIGKYIAEQHHNGIKIGVISRMVQTLNAQVFTKLWQLIVPEMVFENSCVVVMGSEGRGEQIMRTDQDNALILRNGFSHPDLEKFAEKFNLSLDAMGYPLCDGDIMMNNSLWRQPLNRFKSNVSLWFAGKKPEHNIWLAAVLDAAYVCGNEQLLTSLREHIKVAHQNADPMFIRSFAKAALKFGDVNQWWRKFTPLIGKPQNQDIDLKKTGLFPLIHGIRTMALENDIINPTNSKARLMALTQAGVLTAKRSETLNEALEFFMAQRLNVALSTKDKYAKQVDPSTLSALERDVLKECLNVVKSFKNELTQRYQLQMP